MRWRDEDEYMASPEYRHQQAVFESWCRAHGMDPEDAQSSWVYEQWFIEEFGDDREEGARE